MYSSKNGAIYLFTAVKKFVNALKLSEVLFQDNI